MRRVDMFMRSEHCISDFIALPFSCIPKTKAHWSNRRWHIYFIYTTKIPFNILMVCKKNGISFWYSPDNLNGKMSDVYAQYRIKTPKSNKRSKETYERLKEGNKTVEPKTIYANAFHCVKYSKFIPRIENGRRKRSKLLVFFFHFHYQWISLCLVAFFILKEIRFFSSLSLFSILCVLRF